MAWTRDLATFTAAERLSVALLRRADRGSCTPLYGLDLRSVGTDLAQAQRWNQWYYGARLAIAAPGSLAVTRTEQRLLRGLAAAQSGDEALVDNYLYKVALRQDVRRPLAAAVFTLGSVLGAGGFWIDRPGHAPAIPSAGITLANRSSAARPTVHPPISQPSPAEIVHAITALTSICTVTPLLPAEMGR